MSLVSEYDDLRDTAMHTGISAEAVALVEVEKRLDEIGTSLREIADALQSSAPWNVRING